MIEDPRICGSGRIPLPLQFQSADPATRSQAMNGIMLQLLHNEKLEKSERL
jgi:hypothetical protein